MTMKRLHKSLKNKQLDGVCAGIATYANIDPTVVRVAAVILTVVSGVVPGLVVYAVLAVIMPRDPKN